MPSLPELVVPAQDVRTMSRHQLRRHFATKSTSKIVVTRLMRALIVQAHQQITEGREPPIRGNVRTLWYRWVKPVVSRIAKRALPKGDLYDMMLAALAELVMDRQLMSYRDFDFTDENWAHRFIGQDRPEVLLFSEKRGWIRFLRGCHEDLGLSALALGGAPSALTSEYTSAALKTVLGPNPKVRLWGIVDWDPAGAMIARAFSNQLGAFGVEVEELELLVTPEKLTIQEIEVGKIPLSHGIPRVLKEWMASGGGVDGEAFGLESELMPWPRLREAIEEKLK